jgi:hypothetical protein
MLSTSFALPPSRNLRPKTVLGRLHHGEMTAFASIAIVSILQLSASKTYTLRTVLSRAMANEL